MAMWRPKSKLSKEMMKRESLYRVAAVSMRNMVEGANSKHSVVAKPMEQSASHAEAEEEPGWAMADQWTEEESTGLSLLTAYMFDRKFREMMVWKSLKMGTKVIEGEGSELDRDEKQVRAFRKRWTAKYSSLWGSVHFTTKIDPMPFTYDTAPPCAYPCTTLQIYSVKVTGLRGALKWPLDVFGMVAVRDSVDHKLIFVFARSRDNCQTLTEKDPYLALIGPTRAVVLDSKDLITVEAEIKVRGTVESEDRYLSFLAHPLVPYLHKWDQPVLDAYYPSKRSTLNFKFACIASSVAATIFIRVIEGSWPDGVHGQITAHLSDMEHEKVVLLDCGADNVPISGDRGVELSRNVVSVTLNEGLVVSYFAWKDDRMVVEQHTVFKAAEFGRSYSTLQLGTCKLEILVAWSVVPLTEI